MMDASDARAIVDGLAEIRSEIAALSAVMREVLLAVRAVDASTAASAEKIGSAIQRWT